MAGRPADPIWDTLVEVCRADSSEMTKSERGRFNRAVKELKEVGATPDSIRARAGRWRMKYPALDLTPTALVAQWSTLKPPPARDPRAYAPVPVWNPNVHEDALFLTNSNDRCRHGKAGRCPECVADIRSLLGRVGAEEA